jgi:hypothetical protein
MSVPPPFLSRFHAIVTAKSIDGTGPPIITAQPQPCYGSSPYEPLKVRFEDPEKKRRREENAEAGPSTIATKVVKRGTFDEGSSSREVRSPSDLERVKYRSSLP